VFEISTERLRQLCASPKNKIYKEKKMVPDAVVIHVDWQNVPRKPALVQCVLHFAHDQGNIIAKVAYAQWRREKICHETTLHQLGFDCLNVPTGWNNADQKLIDRCRQQVETLPVKTVILVSNDGDFAPLIRELKLKGIRVIVIAGGHCSKKLKKYAHEWYLLDELYQRVA
jgi:hypothetical protein